MPAHRYQRIGRKETRHHTAEEHVIRHMSAKAVNRYYERPRVASERAFHRKHSHSGTVDMYDVGAIGPKQLAIQLSQRAKQE